MQIINSYLTKNLCFKRNQHIKPTMIMLHSTACPGVMATNFTKAWNVERPNGNSVCVHAFVDPGMVYQTLPWDMRAWHCGGIGNNVAIGFEICEPKNYADREYFNAIKKTVLELCYFLCKEYHIDVNHITSHCEGYRKYGKNFASNHSDLDHWWKRYFGYTMDDFREELNEYMEEQDMERYNTIEEVPEWAKESVKKAIDLGVLKGTDKGLDLTRTETKMIVWLDRCKCLDF